MKWTQTLVAGAALAWAVAASAQESVSIRIGHFLPPVSLTHKNMFVPMAEALNKESGGRIKAKVYPGGSLGRNPAQQLQLVKDGVIDVSFIVQSYTPGEFPDNAVMELPLLMEDTLEASLVHQRMFERGLLRGYDSVKVLGLGTTSAYGLHLRFPFTGLDSLAGKKIRAATGLQSEVVSALGATPVGGIRVTQTSEALSRGVIDGTLLGWESMSTFKVLPVTTDHVQVALGFTPLMVAMNKEKYESMPNDLKAILDRFSGKWIATRMAENYEKTGSVAFTKATKSDKNSVIEPDAALQEQLRARLQPVIDKWAGDHPNADALLKALKEEAEKLRGQ